MSGKVGIIVSVFFLVLIMFPLSAQAVLITADTGSSTEGLGSFTGSFIYSFSSPTAATLDISLTNNSNPLNGGYITAFVLNNPLNLLSSVSLSNTDFASFSTLGLTDNGISASPFGGFDFGASTGSGFLGEGSPTGGIGVNQEGTFQFALEGTNLNTLNDVSFLSALSDGGKHGEEFIVRFRGFEDGGSDKVPDDYVVPEPATMTLLGFGLLSLFGMRRKRKA